MSVHLYLQDAVREHQEFESVPAPFSDRCEPTVTLKGIRLYREQDQFYLPLNDENCDVPDGLENFIKKITFRDGIRQLSSRETGIYREGSAVGHLDLDEKKSTYKIKISATSMDDIRNLLRKVRTGTIRPDESYEGAQVGKTRKQLEDEVAQLQRECARAKVELDRLKNAWKQVEDWVSKLNTRFWPFCSKNAIVKKIQGAKDKDAN